MPWDCGTALGMPVEPDVKRYLATVFGPTRSSALSTALVGVVFNNSSRAIESGQWSSAVMKVKFESSAFNVANAGAKLPPDCAKMIRGRVVLKQCRNRPWSPNSNENAGLMGISGTPER